MSAPINGCDKLTISKYHKAQGGNEAGKDVSSLIGEMKRRAGVSNDSELAAFLGMAQSTVANWRKRGAVPEAAMLRFERAIAEGEDDNLRTLYARAVALRVPEHWLARSAPSDNPRRLELIYLTVSFALPAITRAVANQMSLLEKEHGMNSTELAARLLEDGKFLDGIVDWVRDMSVPEVLAATGGAMPNANET